MSNHIESFKIQYSGKQYTLHLLGNIKSHIVADEVYIGVVHVPDLNQYIIIPPSKFKYGGPEETEIINGNELTFCPERTDNYTAVFVIPDSFNYKKNNIENYLDSTTSTKLVCIDFINKFEPILTEYKNENINNLLSHII